MVQKIKLSTAEDLKEFMNLAWACGCDVGVHDPEGAIADAKSILGLIALDYNRPVLVVTEDDSFIKKLGKWIVND
ncbi:HPr family phosphocarrier protein [Oscillospiraceae bacterium MB08-C2-2]|nr:HPr family phosphocarrier protein [Oscillospiraceae bacterium MB08-C2-2]